MTRKSEVRCPYCQRLFWSWGERIACLMCKPDPPDKARLYVQAIKDGRIRL